MDCFNPRPREGGDLSGIDMFDLEGVSIHAPAKGATACQVAEQALLKVSIHAPAKGATKNS